jgi:phosphoglycerol transferase MdoB-like AlkP superfamily enzyme
LFVLVLDGKTRPDDLIYLNPDVVPATSLLRTANELRESRGNMAQKFESILKFDFPDAVQVNLDAAYPLQRRQHEFPPLPFAETSRPENPLNVIVIFAEGTSARLMDTYGGRYADLTPNLNSFAKSAMVVDNYYNHTAATFRGLLGQLTSGHPFYGGNMKDGDGWADKDNTGALSNLNYQTLPNILREYGYDTVFFSPHPDTNALNTMLRALDFQTVHTKETMADLLGRPLDLPDGVGAVQDRDLFQGLRKLMEDRVSQGQTRPFFAATYNIGTHAFRDTIKNGARYQDGENPALNRFHEFDTAIGLFLDYFQNSPYAKNTLLIITTDHATYHEPSFVEAFDAPDFYRFFVDEIPMLIHAPHLDLPKRFDANYENSIDLAPSVLHLLDIESYEHAFLGQSLFVKERLDGFSTASIGSGHYLISKDGIFRQNTEDAPEQFRRHHDLIDLFQALESKNKLFDRSVMRENQRQTSQALEADAE